METNNFEHIAKIAGELNDAAEKLCEIERFEKQLYESWLRVDHVRVSFEDVTEHDTHRYGFELPLSMGRMTNMLDDMRRDYLAKIDHLTNKIGEIIKNSESRPETNELDEA